MTRRILIIAFCWVFAQSLLGAAIAQVHEHHPNSDSAIIDGTIDPELVPDNSAYRLWFSAVAVPANPTDEQMALQRNQLRPLRLNQSDYEILTKVVSVFSGQFTDLIAQENVKARVAAQQLKGTDQSTFLSDRDALVEGAIRTLRAELSPQAMQALDAYIQREKLHMKLSVVTK